jgi:hypothetical protein
MARKPRHAASATVYLDRTDEIASIQDKLEGATGDAVIVVAPRSVRILRTPLYLKLLRRTAEHSGKQIALVAEDWLTRDLARQEGIPVYRSVRRVNGAAFGARAAPAYAGDRPVRALPKRRRWRGRWDWVVRGAALASLVIMAFLGVLMYPTADIRIVPDTQDLIEDIAITASLRVRALSFGQLQIPGRRVESQRDLVEKQIATGKKTRGDESARGQVTLTNNTASPINLPRGFQVQTVDGRRFALQNDLVVPPGARAAQTVPIQAVEPGTGYNVASFVINRPVDPQLAGRLTVVNSDPTQGGTDKTVEVVTAEDIAKARAAAAEKLRKLVVESLYGSLHPRDESLHPETIDFEVTEEVVDRQAGDEAKEVTVRMRLAATAIAFSGNDVNTIALRRLEQGVRPGYQVVVESLNTKVVGLQAFDKESLTFYLNSEVKATPQLDEDRLKRDLANRSPADARAYLAENLLLAEPPEIEIRPDWLGTVPPFTWRINLRVSPRS